MRLDLVFIKKKDSGGKLCQSLQRIRSNGIIQRAERGNLLGEI
jgi:hypothetical protein